MKYISSDTHEGGRTEPRRMTTLRQLQGSTWVLLGYALWLGFYLGAVILHAVDK